MVEIPLNLDFLYLIFQEALGIPQFIVRQRGRGERDALDLRLSSCFWPEI